MIGRLKDEVFTFLLAIQFLTRVPVRLESAWSPERFAASVRHYPLVGLLIGGFAAAAIVGASEFFPTSVAVLLSTGLTMLLTGAFHEDGLSDAFDGIGGGTTRERALEIMKDSRIGVFGMLALAMAVLTKVTTLSILPVDVIVFSLVAAHGLSRWSCVLVIATSRYVRNDGTGKPVAASISVPAMIYATLVGAAGFGLLYFQLTPTIAVGACAGMLIGHTLIRLFYEPKIGGFTGDCLGATQQISELGIYLGILACL